MKLRIIRLIAAVLILTMMLSGCSAILPLAEMLVDQITGMSVVNYEDMEYTRPDMDEYQSTLDAACDTALNGKSLNQIMDAVYAFYDVYDGFYTNYNLADLHYCADLTDLYWQQEYNYCMEQMPAADAGLETLYRALAQSPYRSDLESDEYFGEGYFEAYDGEAMMDEGFVALLEQENALKTQYYDLTDQAAAAEFYSDEYFTVYGAEMAELYVELIRIRQEIAAYAGYDSYPEFAYDYYYDRDYTPAEAQAYLDQIARALYEPYCAVNKSDVWELAAATCSETETFDYVRRAANAMGGQVGRAFELLEKANLYDISYGTNKYQSSFELYLWSYYEPFIFMNPVLDQSDKLTFAHEFGHFTNDYICYGSYAGIDVSEVHSQGMEYLSLCYVDGTEDLTRYKLGNSLCIYMENGAYALFEHRVYDLTGGDLTVENVQSLYEEICLSFGFDSWAWDSRDYVAINHFFTNPLYTMSYVVSNDLAMQIYDLERSEKGAGLELYQQSLNSQDSYIVAFARQLGLESPFAGERLEAVAKLFDEAFCK